MRFNRRQLLACCLALGVIGLVATADPPNKTATAPAKAPTPSHWVVVAEPVPVKPCLPVLPTTMEPPLALPMASPSSPPVMVQLLPEKIAVPPQISQPEVPQLELPKVEAAKLPPKVELPEIKPAVDPTPVVPTLEPTLVAPVAAPPVATEAPKLTPAKAVAPAAFQRIIIDYSSKPLRFEVQSGEISLKVECDAIDVRMPGEQGTTATPLKATGHVKFTAPGCSGVCDELVIYTTSGEAVLHGNVKLQCRQGNVETEVTGTNVKFKLGAAAVSSVAAPGQPNR